jgi:hypothetical protein
MQWSRVKKNAGVITALTLSLILGIYIHLSLKAHYDHLNEERKQVVCPSFLSIARSARDTLIVMRNEPLCNVYVLDNL